MLRAPYSRATHDREVSIRPPHNRAPLGALCNRTPHRAQ